MLDIYKFHNEPEQLVNYAQRYNHLTPEEAYTLIAAGDFSEFTEEQLLSVVLKDPMTSYRYAAKILKKTFPDGESIIATDGMASMYYAVQVLKAKRFKLGEPEIAKNPDFSIDYAEYILKGPFKLAEPIIKTHDSYITRYNKVLDMYGYPPIIRD